MIKFLSFYPFPHPLPDLLPAPIIGNAIPFPHPAAAGAFREINGLWGLGGRRIVCKPSRSQGSEDAPEGFGAFWGHFRGLTKAEEAEEGKEGVFHGVIAALMCSGRREIRDSVMAW